MCGRDPIPPRLAHKHRARSRCSDLSGTPAKPRGPWVHPCTPAPGANEVPGAHRVVAAIDRPRERTPGRPRSGGRGQELARVVGRSAQADRTDGGGCGRGPNTPATGFRSSRCRRGETAREKTHTARLHAPGVTSLSHPKGRLPSPGAAEDSAKSPRACPIVGRHDDNRPPIWRVANGFVASPCPARAFDVIRKSLKSDNVAGGGRGFYSGACAASANGSSGISVAMMEQRSPATWN